MTEVFISPDQLKELVKNNKAITVDCRHDLTDPDWGKNQYQEEHLPDARFAHLDVDLSATPEPDKGRHPLPDIEVFKTYLENNAIPKNRTIVAYDDSGAPYAARFWWMLTQIGYPRVRILEGGFTGWKEKDYPTSSGIQVFKPINIEFNIENWDDGPYTVVRAEEIAANQDSWFIVDSRAPERHAGKEEPYDPVAGRIPGAVNHHWEANLDPSTQQLKNRDQLKKELSKFQPTEDQDAVWYCGSGVSVCHNLAVMEELDIGRPAIYPGSFSQWQHLYPDQIESDE